MTITLNDTYTIDSVNNFSEAYDLAEQVLKKLPNRWRHSLAVTRNISTMLLLKSFDDHEKEVLLMSAILHDIGHSNRLNQHSFHAYDGYLFLNKIKIDQEVKDLVLLHSFSREQALMLDRNFLEVFIEAENRVDLEKLYLLSLADFIASPTGETVTLEEKVQDIAARYGEDAIKTKHAQLVRTLLLKNSVTKNILNQL